MGELANLQDTIVDCELFLAQHQDAKFKLLRGLVESSITMMKLALEVRVIRTNTTTKVH
jgi:hypothetical protein